METEEINVKIFDTTHFDVIGLTSDIWKVVVRFLLGLVDSFRFDHVFRLWQQEPRLKPILLSCFLLNMAYFVIMILIESVFIAILDAVMTSAAGDESIVYIFKQLSIWSLWTVYQLAWAVPMFGASFWRSNKWYAELAELVPPPIPPRTIERSSQSGSTLVSQISDGVSFVLQLMLLKVANSVLGAIPYTGWYLSAILQCLLASFYAFESHWTRCHPGQPPAVFIAFIERDWAYFLGFGVLLTAVTIQLPVFMSLAIYAAILPIFIVVASRPEAAAWQRSLHKPTFTVLPQAIKYFDMGHKGVDLFLIWVKYYISGHTKRHE
jgi:hypothetical protein